MNIKVITPPVLEPITLTEAKAQCRIDVNTEDTLITGYIAAAREYAEKIDWRAYLTQTIEFWLDAWPVTRFITLPRPPLQSVTKIEYYDVDDVKYTLNPLTYYASQAAQPGKVQLRLDDAWPSLALREMDGICVTYKAGWTAAAYVPQRIKQALLLLVGHWFENREATISGTISREIEFAVKALLEVDRAMRF